MSKKNLAAMTLFLLYEIFINGFVLVSSSLYLMSTDHGIQLIIDGAKFDFSNCPVLAFMLAVCSFVSIWSFATGLHMLYKKDASCKSCGSLM